MTPVTTPEIDVDELAARVDAGARVVDVREPDEYATGHVPGAVSIPLATVPEHLDAFRGDEPVCVICQSGGVAGGPSSSSASTASTRPTWTAERGPGSPPGGRPSAGTVPRDPPLGRAPGRARPPDRRAGRPAPVRHGHRVPPGADLLPPPRPPAVRVGRRNAERRTGSRPRRPAGARRRAAGQVVRRPGGNRGPRRAAGPRRADARRRRHPPPPVRHATGGRLRGLRHAVALGPPAGRAEGHTGQGRPADRLVASPAVGGPEGLCGVGRGVAARTARPPDRRVAAAGPPVVGRGGLRGAAHAADRGDPARARLAEAERRQVAALAGPRRRPGRGRLA